MTDTEAKQELTDAWEEMAEAKTALNRAKKRLHNAYEAVIYQAGWLKHPTLPYHWIKDGVLAQQDTVLKKLGLAREKGTR